MKYYYVERVDVSWTRVLAEDEEDALNFANQCSDDWEIIIGETTATEED